MTTLADICEPLATALPLLRPLYRGSSYVWQRSSELNTTSTRWWCSGPVSRQHSERQGTTVEVPEPYPALEGLTRRILPPTFFPAAPSAWALADASAVIDKALFTSSPSG